MTTPLFPSRLVREATHGWNVTGNTMNSGQTATASVDVRSDGGGFWMASLNEILLYERSHVLLWRAVRQMMNGGVNQFVVSRIDRMQPYPGGIVGPVVVPYSDGSGFADGAFYSQPSIDVITATAASLRATTLALDLINCAELLGGELFSIEHPTFGWRLYEIGTVTSADDGTVVVTFNPPLREAVAAGTPVEFDRPRCVMKLANPGAMDLDLAKLPVKATVKFVEAKYQ